MVGLRAILAAAPLALAAGGWARQGDEPLALATRRFFQPGSGTTLVEVVGELRLAALGTSGSNYRVEAVVRDSAGLVLANSSWERDLPSEVTGAQGATLVESFNFVAAPGRYRVTMRALSAAGQEVSGEVEVAAFEDRPAVSDLVIATAVRQPASDTARDEPGEIRRGGVAMRTAPLPRLTPDRATLSYYAEVYPPPGLPPDGDMRVEVLEGESRRRVAASAPRAVRIESPGGAARGSLDLTGLPEGRYWLRMQVRLGDGGMVAEAPFAMGRLVAEPPATTATESVRFAGASEQMLDSLYGPLTYILEEAERRVYTGLSLEGKRRFLEEYWHRRDPTPGTPDNPAMAEFYRTVAYVNEAFREPGAGQLPGWQLDRGRVYLRNGRPDEVLRRPLASPRPYEVWKYTRGRRRFYVFYDQSGFGNYVLIGTNDLREGSRMEWERYLGPEGAQDVAQFIR
jgi:GWxTD domain-containing protein